MSDYQPPYEAIQEVLSWARNCAADPMSMPQWRRDHLYEVVKHLDLFGSGFVMPEITVMPRGGNVVDFPAGTGFPYLGECRK